jgi:hypothetical protein
MPSIAYAATSNLKSATIPSKSDVIITPQSYTLTYEKTITVFFTDFSSIPTTYFYTEYYKDYGWASGNLSLKSVTSTSTGYSVVYSGTMYCVFD